jgi:Glycosyl transferase family 2
VRCRVKLCAIAKDEGAYLADWVHHHLFFGFDAVEVWVNGTSDQSLRILRTISRNHPQVQHRVADKLLSDSLARGKNFQYRAYAKLARRAAAEAFTHVAFLDLDEYWTPADGRTGIHAFLPQDLSVNVVSFPWCIDVPDPDRAPFTSPFAPPVVVQQDRHVKSVVRLDDRVQQLRTHTARTTSGTRLLVRETFPLDDEVAQQWGSITTYEQLMTHWDKLPEAFVLHALHRSEEEYVASLAKGLRQTGADLAVKTNRPGFLASGAPRVSVNWPATARDAYEDARASFLKGIDASRLIRRAEALTRGRAASLLSGVADDAGLMALLRGPLRGISSSALDDRYPGWDSRLHWSIDAVETFAGGRRFEVVGWAVAQRPESGVEVAFCDSDGVEQPAASRQSIARPDVAAVLPGAPVRCGFRAEAPGGLEPENTTLLLREEGAHFWDVAALAGL